MGPQRRRAKTPGRKCLLLQEYEISQNNPPQWKPNSYKTKAVAVASLVLEDLRISKTFFNQKLIRFKVAGMPTLKEFKIRI